MTNRRSALADLMRRSGLLTALEHWPAPAQLVVVNYHRIGQRRETEFDHEVFSSTAEALDAQVAALKRCYDIVDEAEALGIIAGHRNGRRKALLLTFDDGYLDNLTLAVPVLRSHGVVALFFLVTDYLSSPEQIPWWDRIAWLVRRSPGKCATETEAEISRVLRRYREASPPEKAALLADLETRAGTTAPPAHERLLMNWDEARELRDAGMNIGLHTHSHAILSELSVDGQRRELRTCFDRIEAELGLRARSLAYPVGTPAAFGPETKRLARELGLQAAFSFYGGTNRVGRIDPYDVRRVAFVEDANPSRARAAVALLRATRSFWL